MSRGEQRANRAERLALDLAEAVVLAGREGHTFPAVVIDEGDWGVEFQIADPAVDRAGCHAHRIDPGDEIRVQRGQRRRRRRPRSCTNASPERASPSAGDELADRARALEHVQLAVGSGAHRRHLVRALDQHDVAA